MSERKQYIVLPLYFSTSNDLFFRIIEIIPTPKGNVVETIQTISIEKENEEGNKIPNSEYETFCMNHREDEIIVLGKVDITEEYFKVVKDNI
jgi:hypothetical protein